MKPRVGIFGLSGCWGEQIVLLNCEDELPALLEALDIVDFLGGSSRNDREGRLDFAFVEGSVGSDRDERELLSIRGRSATLIACGSCACFGGVAAGDGSAGREAVLRRIYGAAAEHHDSRVHRPLSAVVRVDHAIPGCPMEKREFLDAVAHLLRGNPPQRREYAVCMECKMVENDCLLLAHGTPCLGPLTRAGCDARCPSYDVPCIGCRGPLDDANAPALAAILRERGLDAVSLRRRLGTFAGEGPR